MTSTEFNTWLNAPKRRPLIMGVLNVTPDSFSDGGLYADPSAAAAHAMEMAAVGADLIDIGGESTRPGAQRIAAAEQIRRIVPVLRLLPSNCGAVISIDTTSAEVAQAALDHGAHVLNDISSGREDADMLPLAARREAPIILMHMRGEPKTMQQAPVYTDVVEEVTEFLADRAQRAVSLGVQRARILIDPGIGFGKTFQHNLELLQRMDRLVAMGYPVVMGTSRKSFIGKITGQASPADRLFGTAATVAWSVTNGAAIVRVHDVEPMAEVVRVIEAIQSA